MVDRMVMVKVDWEDSQICSGQMDTGELPKPALIETVGWLAHEGDDYVVIARDHHGDPASYAWRDPVAIPLFAVRAYRRLGDVGDV